MILHDPDLVIACKDYGIMLPISPSRGDRIMDFLNHTGRTMPVYDIAEALCLLKEPDASLITRSDLERVHHKEFIATLYEEGPEGSEGLVKALCTAWELIDSQGKPNRYEPGKAVKPLKALLQNILAQVGGTYIACRLALSAQTRFCYYLGGGMHHARYDTGAGFCLINDLMIAARKIQAENRAHLIWIVDLDAHKGCGTAELIQFARTTGALGHTQDILNLSIHMAKGWPLDEETLSTAKPDRAPCINADVEIPIDRGEEAAYISALKNGLTLLEKRSGHTKPDLVIVVDGADPYEYDGLPSSDFLKLSLDQCIERDTCVYTYLQERRFPSAWIMAGGYGERAWEPVAHFLRTLQT